MSKPTVIAIVNQKDGTGKTCTAENLGVDLASSGRKVLLMDFDPQGSLTISLGYPRPDELSPTISDTLAGILREQSIPPGLGILRNSEGVELMPANIELSGLEVSLVNAMSRETILPSERAFAYKMKLEAMKHPAQRLKKLSQEGTLDLCTMRTIMSKIKKPELGNVTLKDATLRKYFPRSYTPRQMQETIIKLLEQWQKRRQCDMER